MATRTYYKHKRVQSIQVPYSFQCENCKQSSGVLQANIAGEEATLNSNFKTLSDEKSAKLERQAHQNLVNKLKEAHKDAAEKGIYSTEFKDECPHCHKPQSWAVSGLKKKRFDTPIVIFLVGVVIFVVALIAHYLSDTRDVPLSIAFVILGAGAVCAVISLIWNSIKINKKIKATSANGTQNVPDIEWNAVQDLLNEEM